MLDFLIDIEILMHMKEYLVQYKNQGDGLKSIHIIPQYLDSLTNGYFSIKLTSTTLANSTLYHFLRLCSDLYHEIRVIVTLPDLR